MAFRFRLEKMLSITRMRETMKQMEVAAVQGRIEILRTKQKGAEDNLRTVLQRGLSYLSSQWTVFQAQRVKLDLEEMERLEKYVEQEQAVLEEHKAELRDIMKKRQALESFKEKKNLEYKVDNNRREQKRFEENYRLISGAKKL